MVRKKSLNTFSLAANILKRNIVLLAHLIIMKGELENFHVPKLFQVLIFVPFGSSWLECRYKMMQYMKTIKVKEIM